MDIGASKDARGPAAEGEGVPERGRQAAGDRRVGKTAGRHEGCLQKKRLAPGRLTHNLSPPLAVEKERDRRAATTCFKHLGAGTKAAGKARK